MSDTLHRGDKFPSLVAYGDTADEAVVRIIEYVSGEEAQARVVFDRS